MRNHRLLLCVLALACTAMLGGIVRHMSAPHDVFLEQNAVAVKAENDAMAKYAKKTHDEDVEIMANAAKMNAKWGGTFKNGVGSNTWKDTPWAKYDDAVAPRRRQQMLAEVGVIGAKVAAAAGHRTNDDDAAMEKYDTLHPDEEETSAAEAKKEDSDHAKLLKGDMSANEMDEEADSEKAEMHRENQKDEEEHPEANTVAMGGKGIDQPEMAVQKQDPIMVDSDDGDFEDEKPKKMSLSESIAACTSSCKGSKGCVDACNNVMKSPQAVMQKKMRVKHVEEWQVQKSQIIAKCKKACSDAKCDASCEDPANVPVPKATARSFEQVPLKKGVKIEGEKDEDTARTESLFMSPAKAGNKAEPKALTSWAYHGPPFQAKKADAHKVFGKSELNRGPRAAAVEAVRSWAYNAAVDVPRPKTATAQKVAYWEGLGSEKDKAISKAAVGRSLRSPAMPDVPPRAVASKGRKMMLDQINATLFYEGRTTVEQDGGNPYAAGWSKVGGGSLDQVYKGINAQLQPLAQEYPYLRSVRH